MDGKFCKKLKTINKSIYEEYSLVFIGAKFTEWKTFIKYMERRILYANYIF